MYFLGREWILICSCPIHRIRRKQKNPKRVFLFLFKEKVGCLFSDAHKVVRPKKMFRLCICDEFGMRALAKPAVTLKTTTLWREIKLRTTRRNILWIYRTRKVRTWTEYKENIDTTRRLHSVLDNAIDKYRDRRMRTGLFYLARNYHFTYTVRSRLYGESDSKFLIDLWRKKRLESKTRDTDQGVCSDSTTGTSSGHGSNLSGTNFCSVATRTLELVGVTHVFCLLLVILLAWAIVYL
jgi:hypothetical protein